jgi:DNA-binding winged helix-turn-helix (wHTH) protein
MPDRTRLVYEFGSYRLDPSERRLTCEGEDVLLRNKVFDLLVVLVLNAGQLLTNDRLLKEVWDEDESYDYKVTGTVAELRRKLNQEFIENKPGHGYRFRAVVRVVQIENGVARADQLSADEPPTPGGAVPLSSPFYIERAADKDFFAALGRRDSVVLVKGPPQVGKTSLLARGAQAARDGGAVVVSTHLQPGDPDSRAGSESLLLPLAEEIAAEIADKTGVESNPRDSWRGMGAPVMNFQRYLQRQVLEKIQKPMVWVIDDVDELFKCGYRDEIFGMFRWWHNLRAMEPQGPWQQLTLALAYATEAHLFITNPDQSPFNVGTRMTVEDFNLDQVAELNRRYGAPLDRPQDVTRFFELTGGHPYLVQRGLYEMRRRKLDLAAIEARADQEDGIFSDHLRRLRWLLDREPGLCAEILRGQTPTTANFHRLRTAGILAGDSTAEARLRCHLYARYLKARLS